jgi:menaquinone-dependent protoporphyrinogen IX oxidase
MSDTTPQTNTPNKESSPNERLYTTATPIRFAPRGTGGNVVMLDPRNVQQWQLDAYEARLDETASQMAKYKDRVQELESLVEESASNKAGDQTTLRGELDMLREELGKMMSAQQQAQAKKKGGWFPWKTSMVIVLAGAIYFSRYAGYVEESVF